MKETRNKVQMVAFLDGYLSNAPARPLMLNLVSSQGLSHHTVIKLGTQSISFNSVRSTLMIEWLGAVLIDMLLQVEGLQS